MAHGTARRGAARAAGTCGATADRYLGEELVECSDGLVVEALGEVLVDLHKRTATATDRDTDALMTMPTARTPDENDGAAAAAATPFAASAHRAGDGWAVTVSSILTMFLRRLYCAFTSACSGSYCST